MNLLLKDLRNFLSFFLFNDVYDRVFFIEKKSYLKDFKSFLKHQNLKKNLIILTFENLNLTNYDNCTVIIHTNFVKSLIFKTLNARYVYSSTPDLNSSIFIRNSKKNTKYLYIQHSPVGLLNAYKEDSFINFDLIFCNSLNQKEDVFKINKVFQKKIRFWKQKIILEKTNVKTKTKPRTILIAPSWSTNFYIKEILNSLNALNDNFEVTFRPHYMSIFTNEISKKFLEKSNFIEDFNSEINLAKYDLLISDWSGIYLEYLLNTGKKPLVINTKEKNRNELFINELSIEKKLRNEFTFQIEINNLDKIVEVVENLINSNLNKPIDLKKLKNVFYL